MPSSDLDESLVLASWASEECTHLDIVGAWDTLLAVYSSLGFEGPSDDIERIAEFKVVIAETNKFLTRMRNGLNKAHSVEDAIEFLTNHANTKDASTLDNRPAVAYNRLKQHWIRQSIASLRNAMEIMEAEGERDDR